MTAQFDIQPETFEFQPETFEAQPEFNEFESTFGETEQEAGFGEWEGAFGELEAPSAQKNWYYFDAYWRSPNGSFTAIGEPKTMQFLDTDTNASRLFDTYCLNHQNNKARYGAGSLVVRCYQWFPVSSRWVACKNVVGFRRGLCASDESELGQFESELEQSEQFETELEQFESPPGRPAGRGPNFLRPSRGKRIIRGPAGGRPGAAMGEIAMESEVGFDSPTRAPRPVRGSFVNCNTASAAVTAITGPNPVATITQANTRGIQMLDNAINQLQAARARVRGGAAAAPPAVSDVIRQSLQRRFGLDASNRALWTSSAARSILTVIRRLRGARQILADGWMRYICLAPAAPARVTLGSGANSCTVVGCEGEVAFSCGGVSTIALCGPFWRDNAGNPQSLDFQASTLFHEATHIYFGFIRDSGNIANAHCYEQLVLDLNGIAVPANFQGSCPVL